MIHDVHFTLRALLIAVATGGLMSCEAPSFELRWTVDGVDALAVCDAFAAGDVETRVFIREVGVTDAVVDAPCQDGVVRISSVAAGTQLMAELSVDDVIVARSAAVVAPQAKPNALVETNMRLAVGRVHANIVFGGLECGEVGLESAVGVRVYQDAGSYSWISVGASDVLCQDGQARLTLFPVLLGTAHRIRAEATVDGRPVGTSPEGLFVTPRQPITAVAVNLDAASVEDIDDEDSGS